MKHILYKDPNTNDLCITTVLDGPDSDNDYNCQLNFIKDMVDGNVVTVEGDCVNLDDPEENFDFAWELDYKNNCIKINSDEVKAMHMDVVRSERNKKLEDLDKEQLIAMGKNDQNALQIIEEKKTQLRDLPPKVDSILKNITDVNDVPFVIPPEIQS